MSRSVDLFIDSPKSIEELAAEVARLTQLALTPGAVPGTWSLVEGDVHAELRAHPYVDDGELVFQRYRYALSARVREDIRLAASAQAALLRQVSESLHQAQMATLLVLDLQFRERAGAKVAAAEPPAPAAPAEGSLP